MRQKTILVVLLFTLFNLYFLSDSIAQPYSVDFSKVEQLLKDRKWKEIRAETQRLSYKDSRVDDIIDPVYNYLRHVDDCEKVEKQQQPETEILKCYQYLSNSFKQIPRKLPFSSELIAYLNNTMSAANERIKTVQEELTKERERLEAEQQARMEAERKQRLEEEAKKAEHEKQFLIERQKQEEAEKKYGEAVDWAENNIEYKKMEIACEVCQAVKDKQEYERAIQKENQYADKYGVVNLGKIEKYKVRIIRCDNTIREKPKEYKSLTKSNFNLSECKKITLPCDEALENLKSKLVDKYLNEQQVDILNEN